MTFNLWRMMISLPVGDANFDGAREVVSILRRAGHEAWIVGGAVRDMIFGAIPPDYDIATSALPEQIIKLFKKTVLVGVQFGVIRVRLKGFEYEVATFRTDVGYSDGRRPDAVRFTNLFEDVQRRDFSINGLALDPETGEIIDHVGGQQDLNAGVIRAIGDPNQRFSEDHLRPLRAVRFATKTGFQIEKSTLEAIKKHAQSISTVSNERIAEELCKMCLAPNVGLGIRLLVETGLFSQIFPELSPELAANVLAKALDNLPKSGDENRWIVALAVILWPLGPNQAAEVLKRLRYSNKVIDEIRATMELGTAIDAAFPKDDAAAKKIVRQSQISQALDALTAIKTAQGLSLDTVDYFSTLASSWTKSDLFFERLVTGQDALNQGIPPGPKVATALAAVEDAQLNGQVTTKEQALEILKRFATPK
jgi:poly(A) polymerase